MPYRTLSVSHIHDTLEQLRARINERFPDAGLGKVAAELSTLLEKDRGSLQRIARPYKGLRWGIYGVLALAGLGQLYVLYSLHLDLSQMNPDLLTEELGRRPVTFFQGLEAVLNVMLIAGAGVFFLMSLEDRRKRRYALNDLHELRSIAHIIDMHQLTKDPAAVLAGGAATASSPKRTMSEFELMRYLDYCTELLSLTAKVAALYGQSARDSLVITTVTEIESLCTNLASGIWQKIDLIQRLRDARLAQEDRAVSGAVSGPAKGAVPADASPPESQREPHKEQSLTTPPADLAPPRSEPVRTLRRDGSDRPPSPQ